MEGLEISEIKMSFLKKENRTFRIDSNFFIKKSLSVDNKIKSMNHFYISEENIVSGPFGSSLKSDAYLNAGVPFIRIENIKNGFSISTDNLIYISEFDNSRLKSSQLFEDDLILSKVGNTIGYYARVDSNIKNCNISENNIGIKLNSYNRDVKHYIMTFLNSKYGNILTLRRISGNAQPKLNVFDISEIPIPQFNEEFYKKISDKIIKADEQKQHSKSLYSQAEELLLGKLGLKDWRPKNTFHTTKKFSDFAQSGRLDAEYYQPKYDDLFERLQKVDCKTIKEIQIINYRGFQPEYVENGKIDVINSKHILEDGLDYENFEKTDEVSFNNAVRAQVKYGDILTYTTGANIGRTQVYLSEKKAMASNHVNMLRVKDVNPIYLALVLNSKIGRMQTEKSSTGSAQVELYPDDLASFIIPILPEAIQTKIASLIQQSFECKAQSKQLLEDAKRMVESEIEKN